MLHSAKRIQSAVQCLSRIRQHGWLRCYSTPPEEPKHDPLRILFCGADEFSRYSLSALDSLRFEHPSKIASIHVLCKSGKQIGRGLKQIRHPPIKNAAQELEIPLSQIDTFKDWRSPEPYNLVVAVSFGLLVPKRILDAAKYGGLNVHPSLLPDLRGSAPIEHALLKGRKVTGVSLQTMHPTKFDRGIVLKQSEEVPVHPKAAPRDLLPRLGQLGAELLCKGIEEGVFLPGVKGMREGIPDPPQLDLAPKITPEDKHIDWNTWTAETIIMRDHVLGDLWDTQTFTQCHGSEASAGNSKRVTFYGPWLQAASHEHDGRPGEPQIVLTPSRKGLSLGIKTIDGIVIAPHKVTIEGKKTGAGLQALNEQLRLRRKATMNEK